MRKVVTSLVNLMQIERSTRKVKRRKRNTRRKRKNTSAVIIVRKEKSFLLKKLKLK